MAKKTKGKSNSVSINQLSSLIDKISDETKTIIDNDDNQVFISTGVHIMDALLSKSIKNGGIAADRITIFAGEPNTGKSYLLYNIARNAQRDGFYVLFIDTEYSINKEALKGFGIDPSPDKLKILSTNNIEDLKFFLTKFLNGLKEEKINGAELPKVMILLDSIGQLASEKEKNDALEGKSKQDMTRAKAIKQMFRIINADLGYLRIPMVATNHTYNDINAFYPVQIMSGGKGAEYSASTIVFLSTAKLKTGREDELDLNSTGVLVTAQSKKNRLAKPKKVKFEIDHEHGTNRYKGLEYFCTLDNFDKVGIAKGKPTKEEDGSITIKPGGNYWYVRHLDRSMYEKQLLTSEVFTTEILDSLEPIIYKYFDYSSFDEQQSYVDKMENDIEKFEDADFDDIDDGELFE
jgi:RecA/RadA recombinase